MKYLYWEKITGMAYIKRHRKAPNEGECIPVQVKNWHDPSKKWIKSIVPHTITAVTGDIIHIKPLKGGG